MSIAFSLSLLAAAAAGAAYGVGIMHADRNDLKALDVVLETTTLFFAAVIGSFLVTGYLELLLNSALVAAGYAALAAAVAVAVVVAYNASRNHRPFTPFTHGAALIGRSIVAVASKTFRAEPRWIVVPALLTLTGFALMNALIGFPRGTEALSYHLPNGLIALQTQSLAFADNTFMSAPHFNDGLWYAFLLSSFPDWIAALGQLPVLPVFMLAIYGISRRAGADNRASAIVAAGAISIPMIALQAVKAESDVYGLAFVASSVYFLLDPNRRPSRMVLCGLSIALAFGFKNLYMMSVMVLGTAVVTEPWWRDGYRGQSGWTGQWCRNLTIFALAAILVGGYWPLRNFAETGNPWYPLYIPPIFDIFGWPPASDLDYTAAKARYQFFWVRSIWEWPLYPWIEWHHAAAGTHYKSNAGLGAFFAAAVPVACVLGAFESISRLRRNEWTPEARIRLVLLLGGVAIVGLWFLSGQRQPRYVSAAWCFVIPLAAHMLSTLTERSCRFLEGTFAFCILWMYAAMLAAEVVNFGDKVIYSGLDERHEFYEYPAELDRLAEGAVVVNLASRPSNYTIAGANHTNRVITFVSAVRTFGVNTVADRLQPRHRHRYRGNRA